LVRKNLGSRGFTRPWLCPPPQSAPGAPTSLFSIFTPDQLPHPPRPLLALPPHAASPNASLFALARRLPNCSPSASVPPFQAYTFSRSTRLRRVSRQAPLAAGPARTGRGDKACVRPRRRSHGLAATVRLCGRVVGGTRAAPSGAATSGELPRVSPCRASGDTGGATLAGQIQPPPLTLFLFSSTHPRHTPAT
jgi:hypothetical protein